MSKVIEYNGDDKFYPGGSMYANPNGASLFLSLAHRVDVYFPRKRSRVSAPYLFTEDSFEKEREASIEVLPDECLFEIFRRLPGCHEKSICACVSKHWLMLLSSLCKDDFLSKKLKLEGRSNNVIVSEPSEKEYEDNDLATPEAEDQEIESDGFLSRCLEGKKATDVRLAAIAVGTSSRGGLGKLSIHGSSRTCSLSNLGLRAVANGCPSLKSLSLWNVSSIGDEGLVDIANKCHLLEKLDLCHCSAISDNGLSALAKSCPNLTSLTIESCSNIGNEGLRAVGRHCLNLKSISIKGCPLVGDQGIADIFSSPSCILTKVKLQKLNLTDVSLAVIGHYGKVITDLVLTGIETVSERGFWVMGNGHALQKLRSFTVASCQGVTDIGLEAVGKGCPSLKQISLGKCLFVSDKGLVGFARAAPALESLELEECHGITQFGIFSSMVNCGANLKAVSLVSCLGMKDLSSRLPVLSSCRSLQSLTLRNCPGFGDVGLFFLGKLCPQLQHLDLSGLHEVTDAGLLLLIASGGSGLAKVNLNNCVNLTDNVVSALTKLHGVTLETLNLEGCRKVTDTSLLAIAQNCFLLSDLDVSKCAVSDLGVAVLAGADQLNLQILSVSGCGAVTDKCLSFLLKLGETLLGLNLKNCSAIGSRHVDLLVERLWRCDILF